MAKVPVNMIIGLKSSLQVLVFLCSIPISYASAMEFSNNNVSDTVPKKQLDSNSTNVIPSSSSLQSFIPLELEAKEIVDTAFWRTIEETDISKLTTDKLKHRWWDNLKNEALQKVKNPARNLNYKQQIFSLTKTNSFPSSSADFYKVLSLQDGIANIYDGLTLVALSDNELQISNNDLVLISCITNVGRTAFLNQKAVAYNGMKIGLEYIYSYGVVSLTKEGHYGFIAKMALRRHQLPVADALIIDGKIVLESGDIKGNYKIEGIPSQYRLILAPSGGYIVNISVSYVRGDHLSKFVVYSEGVPNPFDLLSNKPSAYPGGHCESNELGQLIFSGPNGWLTTKNSQFLPSDARDFVINESGNIFTSHLQIFNYIDGHQYPISETQRQKEHDKCVIDFPSEALFGYRPTVTINGVPNYSSNIGNQLYHEIAISDNKAVAFYFSCNVNNIHSTNVIMGIPKPGQTKKASQIRLLKATTKDAASVTIDYEVINNRKLPIHYKIFRSRYGNLKDGVVTDYDMLNEGNVKGETFLAKNTFKNVKILDNFPLLPDAARSFIVVTVDCGGESDTIYFKKWMMAAIIHGFDRFAMDNWENLFCGDFSTPKWEEEMKKSLINISKYDFVSAFNWMSECGKREPGHTNTAGSRLATEVASYVEEKQKKHPGDVVDIHLIGHSRGCSVISECLKFIDINGTSTKGSAILYHITGTYFQVTMLDPHPANMLYVGDYCSRPKDTDDFHACIVIDKRFQPCIDKYEEQLKKAQYEGIKKREKIRNEELEECLRNKNQGVCSNIIEVLCWAFPAKGIATAIDKTKDFQGTVNDPPLSIPYGIKYVDVWYQYTKADKMCHQSNQEFIQNLWGFVDGNKIEFRDAKTIIDLNHNLTDTFIDPIGFIGHNEVPLIYQIKKIETGTLNKGRN